MYDDDMEIPELTTEQLKNMKKNPYIGKFSNEDKIVMTIEAYWSYGIINKKELKARIDKILA